MRDDGKPEVQKREIKCPQCGHLTFYSPENASRPFCSERCKLIDLGQWANEDYKIPISSPLTSIDDEKFDLESE